MQTSNGRPSALAHQLAAPKGSEGEHAAPIVPLDGQKGLAGRLMTKEERRKIEEAIDRSESLEGEPRFSRKVTDPIRLTNGRFLWLCLSPRRDSPVGRAPQAGLCY